MGQIQGEESVGAILLRKGQMRKMGQNYIKNMESFPNFYTQ